VNKNHLLHWKVHFRRKKEMQKKIFEFVFNVLTFKRKKVKRSLFTFLTLVNSAFKVKILIKALSKTFKMEENDNDYFDEQMSIGNDMEFDQCSEYLDDEM
jgi:hypothetical protein